MPNGRAGTDESPRPGGVADGTDDSDRTGRVETNDGPDAGCSRWEPLSAAELELLKAGLLPVEIQPWGDHALVVVLRSGARVTDLRTALGFLPEDSVFEGVYGDVEFAVVFEMPDGTEG